MSLITKISFISGLWSLLFFSPLLSAQDAKEDSLKSALTHAASAKGKIEILNQLVNYYRSKGNYPLAMNYSKDAELGLKTQNGISDSLAADIFYFRSGLYFDQGNYTEAKAANQSSINYCASSGYRLRKIQNYSMLGNIYRYEGDESKALEYFLQSLKLSEEISDEKQMAMAYNNIGIVYQEMQKDEKPLLYFKRAMLINTKIGNTSGLVSGCFYIGNLFFTMGKPDSALRYYLAGEELCKKVNDKKKLASIQVNIAQTELQLDDPSKALDHYKSALELAEETGNRMGICTIHLGLGRLYTGQYRKWKNQDDAKKGIEELNKSLNIAKEIGSLDTQLECNLALSDLYALKGDYKNAYELLKTSSIIKDSLINEENLKKVTQMQIDYEFQKKEMEIQLLKNKVELQEKELEMQKLKMEAESKKQEEGSSGKKKKKN